MKNQKQVKNIEITNRFVGKFFFPHSEYLNFAEI